MVDTTFDGMVPEGTPGTYGGITRAKIPDEAMKYDSVGGALTQEMLKQAFEAIERQDEATREWEHEFYKALRPHQHLATSDPECYCAIYRLLQSSRAPISMSYYNSLMAIVESRGIKL